MPTLHKVVIPVVFFYGTTWSLFFISVAILKRKIARWNRKASFFLFMTSRFPTTRKWKDRFGFNDADCHLIVAVQICLLLSVFACLFVAGKLAETL